MPPTWSTWAWVRIDALHGTVHRLDRGGERLPLRPHHQRVDDGEAVLVGDDPGVAHAGLAAGLQPHPDAVGELVERGRSMPRHEGIGVRWVACPPCRSAPATFPAGPCLSVPGSSPKMLGKAPGLGADMVFLDLEDSVAPLEKEAARANVVEAINEQRLG